jgi:LPS O-antigen subunit length determinant protein (WzzB/FepE family)
LASLNEELERQRDDARAERERLRVDHADQLAQAQRNADERVHTLTEALTVAREAAEAYRAQLPHTAPTSSPPAPRKRAPRAQGTQADTK